MDTKVTIEITITQEEKEFLQSIDYSKSIPEIKFDVKFFSVKNIEILKSLAYKGIVDLSTFENHFLTIAGKEVVNKITKKIPTITGKECTVYFNNNPEIVVIQDYVMNEKGTTLVFVHNNITYTYRYEKNHGYAFASIVNNNGEIIYNQYVNTPHGTYIYDIALKVLKTITESSKNNV